MTKTLVFIVAYNHEKFIEKVLERIPGEIWSNPSNEILIIDDGSKDATFKVADVLRIANARAAKITLLKNPVNQGYGGNQKLGYRYAIDHNFDRVALLHGDGQYAPECLPLILSAYDGPGRPDAVFGTRMANWKDPLKGGMPLYKFIGNKILTLFQNVLLSSKMSEFHSGYRSYSVELLKKIPFERNSNDFHFDTEIIIQSLAAGGKIHEVPIPTHYGEEICHVNGIKYAKDVLIASMHYRLQSLGFLYDRRFDVGHYVYEKKTSENSSHARVSALVREGSTVLEIGCGTGQISQILRAKGCIVDGVDMIDASQIPSGILRNYHPIDLNKDLKKLGECIARESYDYIVLGDIIEHLVEPEAFLDEVRESLKANGTRVIFSTPNVAFVIVRLMLLFGQFNYGPRGILDRTHRRLFTRKSLLRLLQQSGYVVQTTAGTPLPLSELSGSPVMKFLENLNVFLMKLFPGLLSYQYVVSADVLPTVTNLLKNSEDYSTHLRALSSGPQRLESPTAGGRHA